MDTVNEHVNENANVDEHVHANENVHVNESVSVNERVHEHVNEHVNEEEHTLLIAAKLTFPLAKPLLINAKLKSPSTSKWELPDGAFLETSPAH